MPGRLFVLSGASGSGKSSLMRAMCTDEHVAALVAPKYSTRPRRSGWDDIITSEIIDTQTFDIAYVLNDRRYGIRANEIRALLDRGKDVFIVLSDFRVVRDVQQLFHDQIVAIYISSPVDRQRLLEIHSQRHLFNPASEQQQEALFRRFRLLAGASRLQNWGKVNAFVTELFAEWREMMPESDSVEVRAEKIRTMHIRYVDKLDVFNHVLLNYTTLEDLNAQMANIVRAYRSGQQRASKSARPPFFVVAAASGAGKGTLMEVLNTIGSERIRIVSKKARREAKAKDKRDGMVAIGVKGEFAPEYDLRWLFHKGTDFAGVEYAVRSSEIERNLGEGTPQIVVSNMDQFARFRGLYPDNAVFVYLHATRSQAENETYQYENCTTAAEAKQRIGEIAGVHNEYVRRIAEFDHVLLNTTYLEDMYDQMFQLLDAYTQR